MPSDAFEGLGVNVEVRPEPYVSSEGIAETEERLAAGVLLGSPLTAQLIELYALTNVVLFA